MKEMFLTITDMTFVLEGEVVGYGRTVVTAAGPEKPEEFPQGLMDGEARIGTFLPAGEDVPRGSWEALLEGEEGFAITFQGDRFLLRRARARSRALSGGGKAAALRLC